MPHFRRSVRKPLLSRTTGSKQKTLQPRQSAHRWITITTCSVIHIFICVFIFSLRWGWWITWLRLCHTDRRKRWLTFCLLASRRIRGGNVTGQLVRSSFMGLVWDMLGRRVKRTALLMSCLSWGNKKREVSQSHIVGLLCSTDGLVIEGSHSLSDSRQLLPKANRYSFIICCLAAPQRGAIPIFCKALRAHVQPRR